MLGSIFTQAINFLMLPFYLRFLSIEEFGIFSLGLAFISVMLIISTLSLNSFLLRFSFDKKYRNDNVKLFSSVFTFLLLINLLISVILFFTLQGVFLIIGVSDELIPFSYILIAIIFFEFIPILKLVEFRVRYNAIGFVIFNVSRALMTAIFAVIFLYLYDYGLWGRYFSILIPLIFYSVYAIFTMNIKLSIDMIIIKEAVKFSSPLILVALLSILFTTLDKVMLAKFVSLESLGMYAAILSLMSVFTVVTQSYYKAVEVHIFKNINTGDSSDVVENSLKGVVRIVFVLSVFFILFGGDIFKVIAPINYHLGVVIIPFLVLGAFLSAYLLILNTLLHAYNRTGLEVLIMAPSAIFLTLSLFILIPIYGVIGVVISLFISIIFKLIISVQILRKVCKYNFQVYYVLKKLIMLITLSALCFYLDNNINEVYGFIFKVLVSLLMLINIWFASKTNKYFYMV